MAGASAGVLRVAVVCLGNCFVIISCQEHHRGVASSAHRRVAAGREFDTEYTTRQFS